MRVQEIIAEADISRRGFLRGLGAAAATAAVPGMAKAGQVAKEPETTTSAPWPGYAEKEGTWPAAKNAPPGSLLAWRGDARTGQIETLPTLVDRNTAGLYLKAYKIAKDNRLIPEISPETWAALLMTEGRSDFGYNGPDVNKKYKFTLSKEKQEPREPTFSMFAPKPGDPKPLPKMDMSLNMTPIRQTFAKLGVPENDWRIDFCETLKDKLDTAKRVGIPFYQAWNGGKQNLARYNAQLQAIQNPKNKPLMDFIRSMTS